MASTATALGRPAIAHGTFTSAGTPVDEVVTVGFDPRFVIVVVDSTATAPEIYMGYNVAAATDSLALVNHDTAQLTSPAIAAGIHFSGRTFTVESGIQNASGVNYYFVIGE
jgi:hypothetical protein